MAGNKTEVEAAAAVEQAMNQVLQAERDAERAIAECEREGRESLTAAHKRSQRIASRTDERIARIQAHWTARANLNIKTMERSHWKREREQSDYQLDQAALNDITETVAAYLTGSDAHVAGGGEPQ